MKLCIWPVWELRGHIAGPYRVRLNGQEGPVMLALLAHQRVTEELLADVLWPDQNDTPECFQDNVRDQISSLRVKLHPFRWSIPRLYQGIWYLQDPAERRLGT